MIQRQEKLDVKKDLEKVLKIIIHILTFLIKLYLIQ